MGRLSVVLSYIISLLLMVFFAWITTYAPPGISWMLYIGYFIVFMAIMMFFTGRSMKRQLDIASRIKGAPLIQEVKKETIEKIKWKDPYLRLEMRAQARFMILNFLPLILIVAIFATPLKDVLYGAGAAVGSLVTRDERLVTFFSNLFIYLMFFLISVSTQLAMKISSKGRPMLQVASKYIITEKGIVADEIVPIEFPIKGEVTLDVKRRFVEIVSDSSVGGMGSRVKQRMRLYHPSPKTLYEIIVKSKKEGKSAE